MMNRVDNSSLSNVLNEPYDYFICCASFEERGLIVARSLNTGHLKQAIVLNNFPASDKSIEHNRQLVDFFAHKSLSVSIRIDQPLYTLDQFRLLVIPAVKNTSHKALIDITTFTHEHLLLLLYFLHQEDLLSRVRFAYTGAQDYSLNTPLDKIWLTKGVKQVRSVIGFPGEPVPSKDLHLIVLVGFEHERAQKVIEAYEPAHLSLGFAPRLRSVSEQHSETNREFFSRVQAFVKETREETTSVSEFEFSCIDSLQTRDTLLTQVRNKDDYNTVICPLNTKISTIGAALAAFDRNDIQLCYAEAAIYNDMNYSSTGPITTIFDLIC